MGPGGFSAAGLPFQRAFTSSPDAGSLRMAHDQAGRFRALFLTCMCRWWFRHPNATGPGSERGRRGRRGRRRVWNGVGGYRCDLMATRASGGSGDRTAAGVRQGVRDERLSLTSPGSSTRSGKVVNPRRMASCAILGLGAAWGPSLDALQVPRVTLAPRGKSPLCAAAAALHQRR